MHESSPAVRGISRRVALECQDCIPSQSWPGVPPRATRDGVQCENLEALTFDDESIDLHMHLDVLEHVNQPSHCFAEMRQTLRPGGKAISTTPVYSANPETKRKAAQTDEGAKLFGTPEYHGNPINDKGAPVTFHYGRDLPDLIRAWGPDGIATMALVTAPRLGLMGNFCDALVLDKPG